jgi:hypothetical protein
MNPLDGGGDDDAYERRASSKCPHPYLLQFIAEIHSRQPRAIINADLLILLMALGMTISCSVSQHLNALTPISSIPLPRETLVRFEQPKNVPSFIALIVSGITISCSDLHITNGPSPISSSPSLRITVVNCRLILNRPDGGIYSNASHIQGNVLPLHPLMINKLLLASLEGDGLGGVGKLHGVRFLYSGGMYVLL